MNQINVVTDSDDGGSVFETQLEPHFAVACLHPDDLPAAAPGRFTLVDVNLRDAARVSGLKQWLERRPDDSHVVFGVNRQRPVESVQAYAVGATDVICKPIDPRMIIWKFSTGADAFGGDGEPPFEMCENLSTTMKALQNIFSAAFLNEPPDLRLVDTASGMLVERIEEVGLARWLNVMRMHHSQTYQHSLIVTSVAVSFGKHLGFSNVDKKRLASAGLLHDIGKARIPLEILEKPAALDEAEMETIRTHPLLGYEALKEVDDLHPEMLDMVVHHHEYLDGSGYPHGISGAEVSDLNRTITIADIFGALIERRAYKKPMPGPEAYAILEDMGAKLDQDLVREFRPIAENVA